MTVSTGRQAGGRVTSPHVDEIDWKASPEARRIDEIRRRGPDGAGPIDWGRISAEDENGDPLCSRPSSTGR